MQELGYKNLEDFYNISSDTISKLGGKALIEKVYDGSLIKSLQSIYPNHKWFPWKFQGHISRGFWDHPDSQKTFMKWVGEELGYKNMEDWYKVTHADIAEKGGRAFLEKFGNSPTKLLQSVFPEHDWMTWRHQVVPHGYWEVVENQRDFVDWAGKTLGLKKMEDWYKVTKKEIEKLGGNTLLHRYGSPFKLIGSMYPEHNWKQNKFKKNIVDKIKW